MSLSDSLIDREPSMFALWPSVWKLLRLRVRIWWNAFKRAKLRSKIGTVIVTLLILAGVGFMFFVSTLLLRFLQSPQLVEVIDPGQFVGLIPTLILTAAFVMIVLTNFGVLLQALYLSHDMDFLVTTPLPMRAVFLAKLLEGILPTFALICAFSLPVLFGLGISSGYSILYYPLLIILLAMLALAAGGLASILVMAVVRVVPARRVAEVLGFLGAMTSILCGQSGNIINALDIEGAQMTDTLGMVSRLEMPWSPLAWGGRGLVLLGQGDWLPGLGLTLVSLLIAGAIFAGTLFLAEQLYYTGWSSMQGSTRKKRAKAAAVAPPAGIGSAVAGSGAAGSLAAAQTIGALPAANGQAARPGRFARLLPQAMRGMIVKDFLVLRRDPRNMSQLITPLIVGFVMLFTTRGGGQERIGPAMQNLGMRDIEVYGLLLLSMFVGWMLMFSLATMAFTREGKNYWFTKIAPVRPLYLLAAKFIVSFLPALVFCLVYLTLGFVVNGVNWGQFPYAALALSMVMAGATGISLAVGAANANLDWDSPQRQKLSGSAGCLVVPAVLGYQLAAMALFIAPPVLWQIFGGGSTPLSYLLGGLLGTTAGVLGVYLPLRLVAPRLVRIGEKD